MKIKLDVTKSLEKNAEVFFEKAKKAKRKLEGAKEAILKTEVRLKEFKAKKIEEKVKKKVIIKKEWYEKFRWFISSEGFLCIGGRDATSNEIVIKKHTEDEDIVFHTSMSGSPFFVIKTKGVKPGEKTLNETAQAVASYSSAWKAGISSAETFYVDPEQVSKKAKAGEFIPHGAFMIYGKKNFLKPVLGVAIGIKDGKIIGGPIDAVKENADKFVIVKQGRDKAGPTSKKIKKKLNNGDLDDIIRFLPSGGYSI